MEKINFTVEGITCEACAKIIKNRLSKNIVGYKNIEIDKDGKATLTAETPVAKKAIEQALVDTDFKITDFN